MFVDDLGCFADVGSGSAVFCVVFVFLDEVERNEEWDDEIFHVPAPFTSGVLIFSPKSVDFMSGSHNSDPLSVGTFVSEKFTVYGVEFQFPEVSSISTCDFLPFLVSFSLGISDWLPVVLCHDVIGLEEQVGSEVLWFHRNVEVVVPTFPGRVSLVSPCIVLIDVGEIFQGQQVRSLIHSKVRSNSISPSPSISCWLLPWIMRWNIMTPSDTTSPLSVTLLIALVGSLPTLGPDISRFSPLAPVVSEDVFTGLVVFFVGFEGSGDEATDGGRAGEGELEGACSGEHFLFGGDSVLVV